MPHGATNDLPPITPCPEWCREDFHSWEPDGAEFVREHRSHNRAPAGARYTLELYTVDSWHNGVFETAEPAMILDEDAYTVEEARVLLEQARMLFTDLTDALQ